MSRVAFLAVFGLGVSLLSPPESIAVCSVTACSPLYNTCRAAASVHQNGCKAECKGNGGGSVCARACHDDAQAARAACKTAKTECAASCNIGDVSCAATCAAGVKTCANYKAVEKPCLTDCKTAVGDALALCGSDHECRNAAFVDYGACYHDCADQITALGAGCQASFDSCIGGCGS